MPPVLGIHSHGSIFSIAQHYQIRVLLCGNASNSFVAAAGEVFDRILQMTDNAGAIDDHRALNYLAMRYPCIYAKAAEELHETFR